ncbi:RNA-guided pseudouridylation complex pseudouridine synthase subunit Cbf5 [Nanoarchaeota archaeon]
MSKLPFEEKEWKILVKKESETSDKYGCRPEERPVEKLIEYGVVNIDKPAGPSSHQVSAYVKQILGIKKAGHSGTLDPAVTGVLPVAVGKGTRVAHALLSAGKEYICLMHLHGEVPEESILETLEAFIGEITQLPPVRSAVKRQHRKRRVYYIDILDIKGKDVLFSVGTQAGTYIRKLCHDMGEVLGTGAHMAELRRTKAGPFNENTICTLQDLSDACHVLKEGDETQLRKIIQHLETGVKHLPKVWVTDTTVDTLCHGASLKVPGIAKLHDGIKKDDMVAVMTLKDELVMTGLAQCTSNEMLVWDKGVAAKPLQVFMQPGTYPKIDK